MNQVIRYPDSNRIGKFNVLHEVLADGTNRPMLQALFGLCVVLDVSENESGRGKTYIAASDLFQPLNEGEEVPEYRIDFAHDRAFPNADHESMRINSTNKFGFVAIRQTVVRVPQLQFTAAAKNPASLH